MGLILLVSVVPGLQLGLLDQHLLLDLVDGLLLLDLHLVDHASILFSQLVQIVHELLVCLSALLQVLLECL